MRRPDGPRRPALVAAVGTMVTLALVASSSPAWAEPAVGPGLKARKALGTTTALGDPTGFIIPAKVPVLRGKGAAPATSSSTTGSRTFNATSSSGSQSYLVADPPDGSVKSNWQVTYTGFDSFPAAKAAFKSAVDNWARIVTSSVTIKVEARFAQLPTGVLGGASACASYSYQVGDGQQWYPSALADAITGVDQSPRYQGEPDPPPSCDIGAEFTIDPDPSSGADYYFGTDGATPAGDYDFKSVVMHEIGHGLGFSGTMDYDDANGRGYYGTPKPDIYDRFVFDHATAGSKLLTQTNGSQALGSKLTSNQVYWGGTAAVAANGGARPRLHAPATWSGGSSIAHLDESTYTLGNPNSLMTPVISYQEAIHSPGPITVGMFNDLGWTASTPVAQLPGAPTGVTAGFGNGRSLVGWTAPAGSGTGTTYTVTSNPPGFQCTAPSGGTSCTVLGLANDTSYTFTVQGQNSAGPGTVSAPSNSVTPDGTAPTATATPLPTVSLASPALNYGGTDAGSGIGTYFVKYQTAPWNGAFGGYRTITRTTVAPLGVPIAAGTTLCFYVVTQDRAGNTSGNSGRTCTVKPLDDRSFTRSSGWGSLTSSAYYERTATSITKTGATLTRTGVSTKRIFLVASTSSTAGTVGIYWNNKLIKQVSLRSAAGNRRIYLTYDFGSVIPPAGTVMLKAMNGSRVTIDGVGFARF